MFFFFFFFVLLNLQELSLCFCHQLSSKLSCFLFSSQLVSWTLSLSCVNNLTCFDWSVALIVLPVVITSPPVWSGQFSCL